VTRPLGKEIGPQLDGRVRKRKYDASRRREMAALRNAARQRETDRREERRETRKERVARLRQRALDVACPDRRCPRCGRTKIRSRQWVLDFAPGSWTLTRPPLCRACFVRQIA
jgi:hypothetical protein